MYLIPGAPWDRDGAYWDYMLVKKNKYKMGGKYVFFEQGANKECEATSL